MLLDWIGLLVVLGFVTIILGVYMLITRSAGIYASPRQFWTASLLSAGIAYLLSGGLFLFLHLNGTIAVAISAIVPFLVGNLDLGGKAKEPAPTDAGLEQEQPTADDEEAEAQDEEDKEDTAISANMAKDGSANHVVVSAPGESEPF